MKIVFFDVQKWEKRKLQNAFPSAQLISDPLSENNAQNYSDAQIVSGFIYSDFSEKTLKHFKDLKFITTRSTGFDHIDLEYCKKNGIKVANVPEYGSNTVAEFTFALILTLTRKIPQNLQALNQISFNRMELTGVDLENKTLGILGFGKIARHVARIAHGFNMRMLVYNRTAYPEYEKQYNLKFTDLKTLLQHSDIISLHLPLTKETYHILNKKTLAWLKKGAYLINTARGGLVDSEALLCAIEDGRLTAAAVDVLEEEDDLQEEIEVLTGRKRKHLEYKELVLNHILINHPKVLVTPHNAFNTKEALDRITITTIKNINEFLKGTPINLVL